MTCVKCKCCCLDQLVKLSRCVFTVIYYTSLVSSKHYDVSFNIENRHRPNAFEYQEHNFTEQELQDYVFDFTRFENELVPDMLDYVEPNLATVYIKFGDSLANTGAIVKASLMANAPSVYWNAEPNRFYTIILTDIDTPCHRRPIDKEMVLWIVSNIPESNCERGFVLSGYLKPKPRKGTGLHRTALILFKQRSWVSFSEQLKQELRTKRKKFCTSHFASNFNFEGVAGGNFWLTEWDESVGFAQ